MELFYYSVLFFSALLGAWFTGAAALAYGLPMPAAHVFQPPINAVHAAADRARAGYGWVYALIMRIYNPFPALTETVVNAVTAIAESEIGINTTIGDLLRRPLRVPRARAGVFGVVDYFNPNNVERILYNSHNPALVENFSYVRKGLDVIDIVYGGVHRQNIAVFDCTPRNHNGQSVSFQELLSHAARNAPEFIAVNEAVPDCVVYCTAVQSESWSARAYYVNAYLAKFGINFTMCDEIGIIAAITSVALGLDVRITGKTTLGYLLLCVLNAIEPFDSAGRDPDFMRFRTQQYTVLSGAARVLVGLRSVFSPRLANIILSSFAKGLVLSHSRANMSDVIEVFLKADVLRNVSADGSSLELVSQNDIPAVQILAWFVARWVNGITDVSLEGLSESEKSLIDEGIRLQILPADFLTQYDFSEERSKQWKTVLSNVRETIQKVKKSGKTANDDSSSDVSRWSHTALRSMLAPAQQAHPGKTKAEMARWSDSAANFTETSNTKLSALLATAKALAGPRFNRFASDLAPTVASNAFKYGISDKNLSTLLQSPDFTRVITKRELLPADIEFLSAASMAQSSARFKEILKTAGTPVMSSKDPKAKDFLMDNGDRGAAGYALPVSWLKPGETKGDAVTSLIITVNGARKNKSHNTDKRAKFSSHSAGAASGANYADPDHKNNVHFPPRPEEEDEWNEDDSPIFDEISSLENHSLAEMQENFAHIASVGSNPDAQVSLHGLDRWIKDSIAIPDLLQVDNVVKIDDQVKRISGVGVAVTLRDTPVSEMRGILINYDTFGEIPSSLRLPKAQELLASRVAASKLTLTKYARATKKFGDEASYSETRVFDGAKLLANARYYIFPLANKYVGLVFLPQTGFSVNYTRTAPFPTVYELPVAFYSLDTAAPRVISVRTNVAAGIVAHNSCTQPGMCGSPLVSEKTIVAIHGGLINVNNCAMAFAITLPRPSDPAWCQFALDNAINEVILEGGTHSLDAQEYAAVLTRHQASNNAINTTIARNAANTRPFSHPYQRVVVPAASTDPAYLDTTRSTATHIQLPAMLTTQIADEARAAEGPVPNPHSLRELDQEITAVVEAVRKRFERTLAAEGEILFSRFRTVYATNAVLRRALWLAVACYLAKDTAAGSLYETYGIPVKDVKTKRDFMTQILDPANEEKLDDFLDDIESAFANLQAARPNTAFPQYLYTKAEPIKISKALEGRCRNIKEPLFCISIVQLATSALIKRDDHINKIDDVLAMLRNARGMGFPTGFYFYTLDVMMSACHYSGPHELARRECLGTYVGHPLIESLKNVPGFTGVTWCFSLDVSGWDKSLPLPAAVSLFRAACWNRNLATAIATGMNQDGIVVSMGHIFKLPSKSWCSGNLFTLSGNTIIHDCILRLLNYTVSEFGEVRMFWLVQGDDAVIFVNGLKDADAPVFSRRITDHYLQFGMQLKHTEKGTVDMRKGAFSFCSLDVDEGGVKVDLAKVMRKMIAKRVIYPEALVDVLAQATPLGEQERQQFTAEFGEDFARGIFAVIDKPKGTTSLRSANILRDTHADPFTLLWSPAQAYYLETGIGGLVHDSGVSHGGFPPGQQGFAQSAVKDKDAPNEGPATIINVSGSAVHTLDQLVATVSAESTTAASTTLTSATGTVADPSKE